LCAIVFEQFKTTQNRLPSIKGRNNSLSTSNVSEELTSMKLRCKILDFKLASIWKLLKLITHAVTVCTSTVDLGLAPTASTSQGQN